MLALAAPSKSGTSAHSVNFTVEAVHGTTGRDALFWSFGLRSLASGLGFRVSGFRVYGPEQGIWGQDVTSSLFAPTDAASTYVRRGGARPTITVVQGSGAAAGRAGHALRITLSPSPLVVAAADMDLTPVFGVSMKKHISEELLLLLEGLFVLELVKLL